ncbi:MAG: hypothetical protein IK090_05400 [Clostridia bacterium]|nr:hypothetical protein [Clostridia bacterium]
MKNAKKPLVSCLLIVLTVLLLFSPFAIASGVYFGADSVYSNTFYGELNEKYDALYSAEGEKIVLIGGSSVAFGYNSETLSELFDRPVINFGLYAELGTKLMLDLAEDAIHEGDIVLLAPELDPQTLSLYFSGSATLKALDDDASLLRSVKRSDLASLWGALWSVTGEKLRYLREGAPDPVGVYNSRNFNEYGDIVYTVKETVDGEEIEVDGRAENVMDGYFDSTTSVIPDRSIVSGDFLDYLNAFIDRAKKRGATVYFAFCPINAMALSTDENGEETPASLDALSIEYGETKGEITGVSLSEELLDRCDAFEYYLERNLHCRILGHMEDFVYAPNYFYDTNFHLNTAGVERHTAGIGNLLYQAENDTDATPLPKSGWMPRLYLPLGDLDAIYDVGDLRYRLTYSDTYSVVGLTDAGLQKETVVLPCEITVFDQKLGREITLPVSSIETGAFSGATRLKTVVIGDANRMKKIGARAFADSSVSELYLFCPVEGFLAGKDMLGGARSDFRIYVGRDLGYDTDYSWSEINVKGQPKVLVETDKTFADFSDAGN